MALAFDIERILAPISEMLPQGENSLSDPKRQQVQAEILKAENAEKNPFDFISGKAVEPPRWKPIADGLVHVLINKSKDFRLVKELSKVFVRLNGVAGLADSLTILNGFVVQYWETAYPEEDPESLIESRLQLIFGLLDANGSLVRLLDKFIFLSYDGNDYALSQVAVPEGIDNISSEERTELIATVSRIADVIAKMQTNGKGEQFQEIIAETARARQELDQLTANLQERCPNESVTFAKLSEMLDDLNRYFLKATGQLQQEGGSEFSAATGSEQASSGSAGGGFDLKAQLGGREEAFTQLRRIAEYFRRTEPHSPISYGIERLLRWGKLSLPELFQEIVENTDVRRNIFAQVGIPEEKTQ